ncbi:hypothetical protein ACFLIM_48390 [Nonomuraea sp. M3C6]|uniref:Core-binding (CB) domain-containing protein n=1 Tax=Nonomuraea marmarensis TaxID=3351344 RepID=A0ABW7AU90_9ACTN
MSPLRQPDSGGIHGLPLAAAVELFLDRHAATATTYATYRDTLTRLLQSADPRPR